MDHFPDRPNIIWILGDQHRAQAVGCLGNEQLATPHLDSLTDTPLTGIAGCPLCSPFRASMLASRWPHECVPGHDVPTPDGTPVLTDPLRENGYHTAYFGKWHVDGDRNREPGQRPAFQTVRRERRGGFDVWLGYENNNAQYDSWLHGHDADGKEIPHEQLPGYETDEITNRLLTYLDGRAQDPDRPFFAVLSVQPPHSPYVAPPEWLARHRPEDIQLRPNVPPVARVQDAARRDLAPYYSMIENLDWNVGRVLAALRKGGLADNTILVFLSDHGDMHGSHGLILKCVPYEESIRIPLLIGTASTRFRLRANCDAPSLLNHVDLPVTTLGLCGIDAPDWMRGTDYSWCWRPDRRETPVPDSALLQLVDPGWTNRFASDRERPWRGIVTRDGWKYAVLEGQPWLLFNLNEDPYETTNLALDGRFARPRRRLQARLAEWLETTGDAFALPELP